MTIKGLKLWSYHFAITLVTRTEFDEWLATFGWHSFRIGAASLAAACGYSDSQISLLGRWKSDTFKRYIRLCSFSHSSTFHQL